MRIHNRGTPKLCSPKKCIKKRQGLLTQHFNTVSKRNFFLLSFRIRPLYVDIIGPNAHCLFGKFSKKAVSHAFNHDRLEIQRTDFSNNVSASTVPLVYKHKTPAGAEPCWKIDFYYPLSVAGASPEISIRALGETGVV